MKTSFFGVNGVPSFVVACGSLGRLRHFVGDAYEPRDVLSPTGATLRAVWVRDEQEAWAVGDGGAVLRWDGAAWARMPLAHKHDDLRAVWGTPDGIWIGGRGCLYLYRPGGPAMMITTGLTVRSLWGAGDELWVLCDGNMVLHLEERGCFCRPIDDLLPDAYQAIGGTTEGDVFAVGEMGLISRWDGHNWLEMESDTGDDLTGICCLGDEDVWATSDGGRLMHYDGKEWRTAAVSPFGRL